MKAFNINDILKYVVDNGNTLCTGWTEPKTKGGYPQLRGTTASRVFWEEMYGRIPTGLYLCHHCDNPECLNPRHLYLATQSQNLHAAVAKGRHKVPSQEILNRIIQRKQEGIKNADIAAECGISRSTVYKYVPLELKRKGNYSRGSS